MHKIKDKMSQAIKAIYKDTHSIILHKSIQINSKIHKHFHKIFKIVLINKTSFNRLAKDKVKLLKKFKIILKTLILHSSLI